MARKVNVSYESLRQKGREEVLDWLLRHEVISYSKPEDRYFVFNDRSQWLLFLPWQKNSPK
jgi:hypothetical protein